MDRKSKKSFSHNNEAALPSSCFVCCLDHCRTTPSSCHNQSTTLSCICGVACTTQALVTGTRGQRNETFLLTFLFYMIRLVWINNIGLVCSQTMMIGYASQRLDISPPLFARLHLCCAHKRLERGKVVCGRCCRILRWCERCRFPSALPLTNIQY